MTHLTHPLFPHSVNKTEKNAQTKWEDIPLTVTVNDVCDPTPEVSITVYSDEVTVKNPHRAAAVLERKYSNASVNGVLRGWGITLDRTSYAKKLCGSTMECYEPDGRYYIVRGACGWRNRPVLHSLTPWR